jgi:hypothetical protein
MKTIEYTIKQADHTTLIDSITKEYAFNCSYTRNNFSIYVKERTVGQFKDVVTIIFDYTDVNELKVILISSGGKSTMVLNKDIYVNFLRKKIIKFIDSVCKKHNWIITEKKERD